MNKQGYTLLEVTLFLGISAALALVAIVGLMPRLRNVQFTDAIRSLETEVNSHFARSSYGANEPRTNITCAETTISGVRVATPQTLAGSSTGTSQNCVINGKMVYFGPNGATAYSIVSLRNGYDLQTTCASYQEFQKITDCYGSAIIARASLTPQPVALSYRNGVRAQVNPPPARYNGFGYVQTPDGTSKYPFVYTSATSPDNVNVEDIVPLQSRVSAATTLAAEQCLYLSNRTAKLSFLPNRLSVEIDINASCML